MPSLRALFWLPALALTLAGCGGDEAPPPASFAPLQYGYLTKLRLDVGAIDIQDHAQPVGDNDLAPQSPVPPAQAMAQMARDRLFAAGTAGTAVFTIDQASIVREEGDTLDGNLSAHLDILDPSGNRLGYAEMHVARQHVPGSDAEDQPTVLYSMTKQMMDDMNVELEYEIKHSLSRWLVPAGAAPAPVQAQPLPGAPSVAPTPLPAPTPAPAAPAPAPEMSPPPGFLHLPGGAS